jgi:hypothetical protein
MFFSRMMSLEHGDLSSIEGEKVLHLEATLFPAVGNFSILYPFQASAFHTWCAWYRGGCT